MGGNYRMVYEPKLCPKHYKSYTTKELAYLCHWYGNISSREIALALGRTQKSVLNKARRLKENGQFDEYQRMYDRF